MCSADGNTGEAREPLSILTATCIVGVALAAHIGCKRLVLDSICPPGTQRTVIDSLDKRKSLTVDCDWLHELVCGAGAVSAEELMRQACGLVP